MDCSRIASACLILGIAGACATPPGTQTRLGAEAMSSTRRIAVEIPDPGEFETPLSRGQGTALSAAAAGMLVATVIESMNDKRDDEQAERVAAHLESADCRAPLEAAFREALIGSRRFQANVSHQAYDDPDLGGYDALVRIEIEACGFRMIDSERQLLSAFVDLTLRVKTRNTRSTGWSSRQSFAGNARAFLYELESDPELVRSEFQQVLRAAGLRLASELLYP